MSADQYRQSAFVKEKKSMRIWLPANELFTNARGREELTAASRRELDSAMSEFVQYLPNQPVMVEGYSDQGTASEQYLVSEQRATMIRDYLINRFHLKPQSKDPCRSATHRLRRSGKQSWDGVSLVVLT
jgi:outer membrane protein OmpA-like peptidoglycan-associated protein